MDTNVRKVAYPLVHTYGAPIAVLLFGAILVIIIVQVKFSLMFVVGICIPLFAFVARLYDTIIFASRAPIAIHLKPEGLECRFLLSKGATIAYSDVAELVHVRRSIMARQFALSGKLVLPRQGVELLVEPRAMNHFDVLIDALSSNNPHFQYADELVPFMQSSLARSLLRDNALVPTADVTPAVLATGWWKRVGVSQIALFTFSLMPAISCVFSRKLASDRTMVLLSGALAVMGLLFWLPQLLRSIRTNPLTLTITPHALECEFLLRGRQEIPYDTIIDFEIQTKNRMWAPLFLLRHTESERPVVLWPVDGIAKLLMAIKLRKSTVMRFT